VEGARARQQHRCGARHLVRRRAGRILIVESNIGVVANLEGLVRTWSSSGTNKGINYH
jgi:hypothetical protein